ncbi:acyltransferase family protein [Bifidobacterium aerophilum]|uniref:Acyltransferase family protein n=2 Tax=Bifidobacterium aerophilum TaxID=1798155 RepID=A0A6N9Z4H4_9BIFI|nr:acyltransferase family protein [Bifidobacterium aerophilum]
MDGIKGFALIGIMWYHLSQSTLSGGFVGVDVFFTVSGFLLGTSLLREIDRDGGIDIGWFYLRRLARLWPAMAFMILTSVGLGWLVDRDTLVHAGGASLSSALFATNWYEIATGGSYFDSTSPQLLRHLWFVALLAQFTIIMPLLVLLLHRIRPCAPRVCVTVALAVLSAVGMAVLFRPDADPTRVYFGTDTHCFGLFMGLALAMCVHRLEEGRDALAVGDAPAVPGRTVMRWARMCAPWLATVALVTLIGLMMHVGQDASAFRGGLFAASVLSLVLIGGSIVDGSWMDGLFAWRPLALLGKYSYGVYLWHWPLFLLIQLLLPAWRGDGIWLIWLLTLVASGLMAALSWWMIERPIAEGLASLRRRRADRAEAPAQARIVTNVVPQSYDAPAYAPPMFVQESVPAQEDAGARAERPVSVGWLRATATVVIVVLAAVGFLMGVKDAPAKSRIQMELERNQGALNAQADKRQSDAEAAKAAAEAKKRAEEAARKREQAKQEELKNLDGKDVTVIGDSVTVGASPALNELLPGIVIDAQVSRSVLKGPGIVSTLKSQGQLRKYVVISLNTNSQTSAEDLDAIVNAAGDGHVFVLVTAHGDRAWIPPANQATFDYASSHAANVTVADWNAAIGEHPEMLGSDGIHPGPEGQKIYAQTVKDAIAGWIVDH